MRQRYRVSTIAGNGKRGLKDGDALEATFDGAKAMTCSVDGKLYIFDDYGFSYNNTQLRMMHNNQVTTISGNVQIGLNGKASEAVFRRPRGICCSMDGRIYISECSDHTIRMTYNKEVTIIAGNGKEGYQDGNALEAMFNSPTGLCCSTDGRIYVADTHNHRVRMIYNSQVTTIAGNGEGGFRDGDALNAMFYWPKGICCSKDGELYVADTYNHRIRMIYDNKVFTVAGRNGSVKFRDGATFDARFNGPEGICCSEDGRIYI